VRQRSNPKYLTRIEIGGMPIAVFTDSADFHRLLKGRYGEFASQSENACEFELEVQLVPPGPASDVDVSVRRENGVWIMERGDFHAEWNTESRRGWVRQSLNPYSIDGVLRILHSLILAKQGGFLVHGASAICHDRAYIFAGVSGAGKTTISRLAPPDVKLLTDEISYVRPWDGVESGVPDSGLGVRGSRSGVRGPKSVNRQSAVENRQSPAPSPESLIPAFWAFGTPFAGELARIGENVRAPLGALYLLRQGPENKIETVSEVEATQSLMRNILFFAHDPELVNAVFRTAVEFVRRVPVRRLTFVPDPRVWEMIGVQK